MLRLIRLTTGGFNLDHLCDASVLGLRLWDLFYCTDYDTVVYFFRKGEKNERTSVD